MKVTDKITITNECNLELMKRFPDNHFDLAIVDPPYGIGEDGGDKKRGTKGIKTPIYTKKYWDTTTASKKYFKELKRISKNQIIWGANHFIENLMAKNSSCWIVWDKDNTGDFADCELAWTSFKTAVRKFEFRWNGMLQGDMKNKEIRIHPTQKPVALYKWLLDKYAKIKCNHKHEEHYRYLCTDCNNGNIKILDTHLGSGSIAIACHDYGFELTACELDKEYFDKAIQRINNHVSQQKLF
jgi:site-specific DNA-methyltransferase (adenine-specific)